jgi:hypothetical protein
MPATLTAVMMQPSTEHKVTPEKPTAPAEPISTGSVSERSGLSRKADVASFLRDALANGPVRRQKSSSNGPGLPASLRLASRSATRKRRWA